MASFEETLTDVEDLLGRVRGWRLSDDGWSALHTELGHLADALAQRDTPAARLALGRAELAGPMLGAPPLSPSASVDDDAARAGSIPLVVNQTVLRIGAVVARVREPPGAEPPEPADPAR